MGIDLEPKELMHICYKIEAYLLHRGTMRSLVATMEARPVKKNYK
jgi:hypothetical protein